MRLFLDANILFTAARNPKGKAALVMELGQAGIWQLATSAYAGTAPSIAPRSPVGRTFC